MVVPGDRKSTRLNSSHTVIYTLSLHDALPISESLEKIVATGHAQELPPGTTIGMAVGAEIPNGGPWRSEEHTSELQSHSDLHSFPTRRSSDLRESRKNSGDRPRTGAAARDHHWDGRWRGDSQWWSL